ncbi:MAG: ribonuclease Z [Thermoplasmata archaeon]
MQIVFLGTGGSWPSPRRNVAAVAVKRGREIILFDCGEGTQRQFMISSLSFMQVQKIFITHFHGDHFLGLPGLIQSMTLNDRTEQLSIWGPKGIKELTEVLLRIGHFNPGFDVYVGEMEDGSVIEFSEYSVKGVGVRHNVPCIGYVLQEKDRPGKFNRERAIELGLPEGPLFGKLQKGQTVQHEGKTITPNMVLGEKRAGRKIAYSGDTLPSSRFADAAKDCDVLIHDATTDASLEEKANEFGHSSSRQAAQIARDCRARMLFLVHVSPRYEDVTTIENDAREIFEKAHVPEDFHEHLVRFKD